MNAQPISEVSEESYQYNPSRAYFGNHIMSAMHGHLLLAFSFHRLLFKASLDGGSAAMLAGEIGIVLHPAARRLDLGNHWITA